MSFTYREVRVWASIIIIKLCLWPSSALKNIHFGPWPQKIVHPWSKSRQNPTHLAWHSCPASKIYTDSLCHRFPNVHLSSSVCDLGFILDPACLYLIMSTVSLFLVSTTYANSVSSAN